MINRIIRWSLDNRLMIWLLVAGVVVIGIYSINNTAVDAIPDLSDVQVIIRTSYPGQAPQVVEDQVTYPLTTAMLSVPRATTVRGFSFYGDSYVYVIFEDGTDLYWARSRVLEYLNQVVGDLPSSAKPRLGPDATGVGWIYQYVLIDSSGNHDLGELTALQDWFLKFELQSVPGVAEIASVGGMVKQYQVVVDPDKLQAFNIPLDHIRRSIQRANQETGASVIEMAEAEYMVRMTGYLQSVADLENVPLGVNDRGTPLLLSQLADIREGPQMRRGIAELNGNGEVVGGIVVMRFGENADKTIRGVKARLAELKNSLPKGVEIIEVYDRSALISAAVTNLFEKIAEEFVVVALVCIVFLFHFRSSLVVVMSLPVGILAAFSIMYMQGINANIMSLGGIAIAVGAMVDGAIVMIENVHRHMEQSGAQSGRDRWQLIYDASCEVGAPLFFALLIITVSFVPVFSLQAQEGRLFSPLAFTKTYAMAASAIIAITLVPVLMGYFIRGRIRKESDNPLNRVLAAAYRPVLQTALRFPKTVIVMAIISMMTVLVPLNKIGSEFMPPLDEGDLMYMPTMDPGISIGKARQILQQTDKLIISLPEVESVFGKIGRADSATDPAPLSMIETIIRFKPKDQWRHGMTSKMLREELDARIQLPGVTNAWVMPIKTRIDMLATGIKTPVGIKVAGPDLKQIQSIGRRIEEVLEKVDGTASVYAEKVSGGRYITVEIDRIRAARFGLNVADIQEIIQTAIGGTVITETVEGRRRFPVNLRYPQRYRDSADQLGLLPLVTADGFRITLEQLAKISIEDGPPAIKSENARINGWIYIDILDRDLGSYVEEAQEVVRREVHLPPGYSLKWSGQYEYMIRAQERLKIMIPVTLAIIMLLLYMNFGRVGEVLLIMVTLPFSLIGGFWLIHLMGHDFSVATGVGFIALAGLAVEIGILMLTYLNQSLSGYSPEAAELTLEELNEAVLQGAVLRLRPILMTVTAIVMGLLPIMLDDGTGSDVMQRVAGPMIGGMLTTALLSLLVIPAVYSVWKGRAIKNVRLS